MLHVVGDGEHNNNYHWYQVGRDDATIQIFPPTLSFYDRQNTQIKLMQNLPTLPEQYEPIGRDHPQVSRALSCGG